MFPLKQSTSSHWALKQMTLKSHSLGQTGGNLFSRAWSWIKDKGRSILEGIKGLIRDNQDTIKAKGKELLEKAINKGIEKITQPKESEAVTRDANASALASRGLAPLVKEVVKEEAKKEGGRMTKNILKNLKKRMIIGSGLKIIQ